MEVMRHRIAVVAATTILLVGGIYWWMMGGPRDAEMGQAPRLPPSSARPPVEPTPASPTGPVVVVPSRPFVDPATAETAAPEG
jgi:hypothetical protein